MQLTRPTSDSSFFKYWESLGFFDFTTASLPPGFMVLFDIARILETESQSKDAADAVKELSRDTVERLSEEEETELNRIDRTAPLSHRMEIETFQKINELKKALPRELALDDEIFNIKLFTRSLMVQKYYESEHDTFNSINQDNSTNKTANRFEQKFYILLDRSRSMDKKYRHLYSKCIIIELLKRKMDSGAKLFYRPFDSTTGSLSVLNTRNDFPILIERILLTETGGTSTNLQQAISDAIDDINYEKDMMHSEILVITDGLAGIDKESLKKKLGSIKLNILKIGSDVAEPDWFELEDMLKEENLDFNPFQEDLNKIEENHREADRAAIEGSIDQKKLAEEKRSYRLIQNYFEKISSDLKEISSRVIEVGDLAPASIFTITPEVENAIHNAMSEIEALTPQNDDIDQNLVLYKKAHFLLQYISALMEHCKTYPSSLNTIRDKLFQMRTQILSNPELLEIIKEIPNLNPDKQTMKLAAKEAKKLMKQVQMNGKSLKIKQMKSTKLLSGGGVGRGAPGQLFLLLFMKLYYSIKSLVTGKPADN